MVEASSILAHAAVVFHYSDKYFNGQLEMIKNRSKPGEEIPDFRRLSRVHLHSLSTHVIAQRKNYGWADATVAAAAGSYIATIQVRGSSVVQCIFG